MCEQALTVSIDSICKSSKQEDMVKEHQLSQDEVGVAYECQSNAGKRTESTTTTESTTNHLCCRMTLHRMPEPVHSQPFFMLL